MDKCPSEIIVIGHQLAGLCRSIVKDTFRQGLTVRLKNNLVPVTQVDLAIETVVRDYLAKARPNDGVLGEEFAPFQPKADLVWIIDPIVGTKNFIAGQSGFCTLIGCQYKEKPIFGLMDQPITGDRWIGAKGYSTTLNDNRIETRKHNECDGIRIAITDSALNNNKIIDAITNFEKQGAIILKGGDNTLCGMVSAGWLDVVLDIVPEHIHHFFPLIPIIVGAGGVIADNDTQSNELRSGNILVVAGNKKIYDNVISKMI